MVFSDELFKCKNIFLDWTNAEFHKSYTDVDTK